MDRRIVVMLKHPIYMRHATYTMRHGSTHIHAHTHTQYTHSTHTHSKGILRGRWLVDFVLWRAANVRGAPISVFFPFFKRFLGEYWRPQKKVKKGSKKNPSLPPFLEQTLFFLRRYTFPPFNSPPQDEDSLPFRLSCCGYSYVRSYVYTCSRKYGCCLQPIPWVCFCGS